MFFNAGLKKSIFALAEKKNRMSTNVLELPTDVFVWYEKHLVQHPIYDKHLVQHPVEIVAAKRAAQKEVWSLLDRPAQKKLKTLFIEIQSWHVHHTPVQEELPRNLYFAAVVVIPMIRCPYLESLGAYDTLTSTPSIGFKGVPAPAPAPEPEPEPSNAVSSEVF